MEPKDTELYSRRQEYRCLEFIIAAFRKFRQGTLPPESLKNGVHLPKNIIHEGWLLNYETELAPADFHLCVSN